MIISGRAGGCDLRGLAFPGVAAAAKEMNYRHGYHAGNFADVIKHIALVAILQHLKKKDAAFAVMDSHAGRGRYDLAGVRRARPARPGTASPG